MKYKTIVIDPPWDISKNNFSTMKHTGVAKKEHYEYMTNEQIKKFPINNYADSQCDIFLWTITNRIRFSFDLLESWGFRFIDFITWDKELGVPVNGIHRRAEWCLYGNRGKMGINKSGKFIPTIIREKRTTHSTKPELFYEILKNNTLEPRIDIFSRAEHDGFDQWGDQAVNPIKEISISNICDICGSNYTDLEKHNESSFHKDNIVV